jgi:hypothetical protein
MKDAFFRLITLVFAETSPCPGDLSNRSRTLTAVPVLSCFYKALYGQHDTLDICEVSKVS